MPSCSLPHTIYQHPAALGHHHRADDQLHVTARPFLTYEVPPSAEQVFSEVSTVFDLVTQIFTKQNSNLKVQR
jgi:hypothetical protein